jgi:hypothetical protein
LVVDVLDVRDYQSVGHSVRSVVLVVDLVGGYPRYVADSFESGVAVMSELQSLLDTDESGNPILPRQRTFLVTTCTLGGLDQVMLQAHSISQVDGALRFHEFTFEHIKGERVIMQWERRAFAKGAWLEFQELLDVSPTVQ